MSGYTSDLTDHLEMTFGQGHLSSGGIKSVNRMVGSLPLQGLSALDFGSGLGAVGQHLVSAFRVGHVTGVDVEPHLIERSRSLAALAGLQDRLDYHLVRKDGAMPFPDATFDLVYSKEVLLHVRDKRLLLSDFHRVLRPYGRLLITDWVRPSGAAPDEELTRFLEIDGLSFFLQSSTDHHLDIESAGFRMIETQDQTPSVLEETRADLRRVTGSMKAEFTKRFSVEQMEEYVTSWRLQERLLERGALGVHRFLAIRS